MINPKARLSATRSSFDGPVRSTWLPVPRPSVSDGVELGTFV